jgi:ketosteroid isomerase-like protein
MQAGGVAGMDRADRLVMQKQIERLFEARIRGDVEGVLAECTEDASFELMGDLSGQQMVTRLAGKDQLRSEFTGIFLRWRWDNVRTLRTLIDGNCAVIEFEGQRFHTISRRALDGSSCHVLEFRDGKISLMREYTDTFSLARIAGPLF